VNDELFTTESRRARSSRSSARFQLVKSFTALAFAVLRALRDLRVSVVKVVPVVEFQGA